MAWPIEPRTDLVLQLHMLPTGKPEPTRTRIGLTFSDTEPTQQPIMLRLGSTTIDIPAGQRQYVIEDGFQVPVDVRISSVYPHAHYLAKTMYAIARRFDETTVAHQPVGFQLARPILLRGAR